MYTKLQTGNSSATAGITFVMLSASGDDRLVWDAHDLLQVVEALEKFKALLAQGFSAFLVGADGIKGRALKPDDFGLEDVRQAEEILFIKPIVGG